MGKRLCNAIKVDISTSVIFDVECPLSTQSGHYSNLQKLQVNVSWLAYPEIRALLMTVGSVVDDAWCLVK